MPGHAGQAVVRIVGHRLERDDPFLEVGRAVSVAVPQPDDAAAFGEVHPGSFPPRIVRGAASLRREEQVHRGRGAAREDMAAAARTDHDHLVMFGALVSGRPEVRVAGDDPDASGAVDVDARGRDDVGMLADELEAHARCPRRDARIEVRGHLRGWWRIGGDADTRAAEEVHPERCRRGPCSDQQCHPDPYGGERWQRDAAADRRAAVNHGGLDQAEGSMSVATVEW